MLSAVMGKPHRILQKRGGFLPGKAQIVDTQLFQLASGAQTGERYGRIRPRGNDQMQANRQMLE